MQLAPSIHLWYPYGWLQQQAEAGGWVFQPPTCCKKWVLLAVAVEGAAMLKAAIYGDG